MVIYNGYTQPLHPPRTRTTAAVEPVLQPPRPHAGGERDARVVCAATAGQRPRGRGSPLACASSSTTKCRRGHYCSCERVWCTLPSGPAVWSDHRQIPLGLNGRIFLSLLRRNSIGYSAICFLLTMMTWNGCFFTFLAYFK